MALVIAEKTVRRRVGRTVREEIEEGKREDLVRKSRRVMESEGDTSLLNVISRAIAASRNVILRAS